MTLALPDRMVSQAISTDCSAVALKMCQLKGKSMKGLQTYQAPTGILTGPDDDKRSKLIQPAVVLMKLKKS